MKIISTSDSLFSSFLPKRNENTSKFDYGRAVLIGGSKDYGGAPLLSLASLSSLRLGAGFATLYVPEPLYSIYVGRDPQIIVHSFPSKDGNLLFDSGYLEEITKKATAIAIGMGVTGFEECQKILEYLLKNYHGYLIVDAGALRAFANIPNEHLKHISCHLILTPHTGEFSSLSGFSREEIEKEPVKCLLSYLEGKEMTVLLKGHVSYISDGKEMYSSSFGNTGLAKAGSGDLLSGILCGVFAQKIEKSIPLKVAFGSYLLGKSADLLLEEECEYSIIANDIIRILPKVISRCVEN